MFINFKPYIGGIMLYAKGNAEIGIKRQKAIGLHPHLAIHMSAQFSTITGIGG